MRTQECLFNYFQQAFVYPHLVLMMLRCSVVTNVATITTIRLICNNNKFIRYFKDIERCKYASANKYLDCTGFSVGLLAVLFSSSFYFSCSVVLTRNR